MTDVNGQHANFTYDGRGRLTATTYQADGSTSSIQYNSAGLPEIFTDADGISRNFIYDENYGRLSQKVDLEGNYIHYDYDTQGNLSEQTKHKADSTQTSRMRWNYQHPNLPGRLWKIIRIDDSFSEYDYDIDGNVISYTDFNNHTTTYSYDHLNRLTSIIQPGNVITQYGYDAHGNLGLVIDANGNQTHFNYDDMDRLISTTSPDTGTTSYMYDNAGNLEKKTDAKGITIQYTYDDLNRMTGIYYPDPSENVAFTYDQGINGLGHRTGVVDPAGNFDFGYDARGRLVSKASTIQGQAYTFNRIFSPGNRIDTVTYPTGRTIDYIRHSSGLLDQVTTTYNTTTKNLVSNMVYNPFGTPKGLTTGAGGTVDNVAGGCDCLEVSNPGQPMEMNYTYDNNKNLVTISAPNKSWYDRTFTYDPLNRLTGAIGIYGDIEFAYDMVGNRLSRTIDGVTENHSYTLGTNRIEQVSGIGNPINYTYDADGNITGIGNRTFAYNQNNRLIRVEQDSAGKQQGRILNINYWWTAVEVFFFNRRFLFRGGGREETSNQTPPPFPVLPKLPSACQTLNPGRAWRGPCP